jgi:hypothetical protein
LARVNNAKRCRLTSSFGDACRAVVASSAPSEKKHSTHCMDHSSWLELLSMCHVLGCE